MPVITVLTSKSGEGFPHPCLAPQPSFHRALVCLDLELGELALSTDLKHSLAISPDTKVAVVLGGGGGRGIAHLGVMRAIAQQPWQVGSIYGVSIGALVASLCATEPDIASATDRAREYLLSRRFQIYQNRLFAGSAGSSSNDTKWLGRLRRALLIQKSMTRAMLSTSLLPASVLQGIVFDLVPDIDIRDVRIPLRIVSVDVLTGERMVHSSGSLRQAVLASMSIPGVFPPVRHEGRVLADIGVFDAIPCDLPKEDQGICNQDSLVVGVDIGQEVQLAKAPRNSLESLIRFQNLAEGRIRQTAVRHADILIQPGMPERFWFDFSNPDQLFDVGYQNARDQLKVAVREEFETKMIHQPEAEISI